MRSTVEGVQKVQNGFIEQVDLWCCKLFFMSLYDCLNADTFIYAH